jgi:hypothetical protein
MKTNQTLKNQVMTLILALGLSALATLTFAQSDPADESQPSDTNLESTLGGLTYEILSSYLEKPVLVVTQNNKRIEGGIFELSPESMQIDTGNEIIEFESLAMPAFCVVKDDGDESKEIFVPTPFLREKLVRVTTCSGTKSSTYDGVIDSYTNRTLSITTPDGFKVNLPLERICAMTIEISDVHQITYKADGIDTVQLAEETHEETAYADILESNRKTRVAYGTTLGVASFCYPMAGIFRLNPDERERAKAARPLLIAGSAGFAIAGIIPGIMIRKMIASTPSLKTFYQRKLRTGLNFATFLGIIGGIGLLGGPEMLYWQKQPAAPFYESYNAEVSGVTLLVVGIVGSIASMVLNGRSMAQIRQKLTELDREAQAESSALDHLALQPVVSLGEDSYLGMNVSYRF